VSVSSAPEGLDTVLEAPPARVLIVDDEAPARNRLRDQLRAVAGAVPVMLVGEAADANEALALIVERLPDIVLLDVHMPGTDGLVLAREIERLPDPPLVVFTTAHAEHALAAFEVNAADYLLKPVRASRLQSALERSIARLRPVRPAASTVDGDGASHLHLSERGRLMRIPVEEILYLRADAKYVTVRTRSGELLTEESLVQLEQAFAGRFVRIHRSCLVSALHLRSLERLAGDGVDPGGWVVRVAGTDERLPVSRRQWPLVREWLGG
jgi:two-component system response regulator AlgR